MEKSLAGFKPGTVGVRSAFWRARPGAVQGRPHCRETIKRQDRKPRGKMVGTPLREIEWGWREGTDLREVVELTRLNAE